MLSGGIAEAGETYIEQIRRAYAKHTWTKFPNPVRPVHLFVVPFAKRVLTRSPLKPRRCALRRLVQDMIPAS